MLRQWFAVVALFAATAPSQDGPRVDELDNGLRLLHVPSAEATEASIALAVPAGWEHDPAGRTGCAEVMRWLFDAAQADVPVSQRFAVDVQPRLTLLSHRGPRRDAVDRLAFVESLLAGRMEVSEDRVAIALGRARLESDDHSWLFPGSVIEQKAWRTLLRGRPGGRQNRGIAAEIARLDTAAVRRRYKDRYGCTGAVLVVIGDLDAKTWTAFRGRLAALERTAGPPPRVVHDAAPALVPDAVHERIGGPYVTAAIAAPHPGDEDYLAFVVAMIVLRDAAYAELRQHGMAWKALSPPFQYAYWKGETIVRVSRRGRDGTGVATSREAVAQFLARTRAAGVRRSALQPAQREVASTMAVPPYASPAGPYLILRARYLATAICLGWPLDAAARVGSVRIEDVNRVLESALAPERIRWFSLRPAKPPKPRRL